jgi:hypothetical protein
MNYQEEMEIAGRVVAATRKLAQAVEGTSVYPFEMLQALHEAKEAFEDALEIVDENHPLRAQILKYIEDTECLQRRLIIEM